MSLGEVISILEAADPDQVLPIGFAHAHSWRGDYMELAFEVREDVTVGSMLAATRSALGATYQGWKGGDYTMGDYTACHLVPRQGDSDDELIAPLFLALLLENRTIPVSTRWPGWTKPDWHD